VYAPCIGGDAGSKRNGGDSAVPTAVGQLDSERVPEVADSSFLKKKRDCGCLCLNVRQFLGGAG
jgi:hypothetical protein